MAKRVAVAVPSIGDDFSGVQVILHPTQKKFLATVKRKVPGASVSVGPDEPMWGARVIGATSQGHYALSWFWEAGYRSVQETLQKIGVNTEWID